MTATDVPIATPQLRSGRMFLAALAFAGATLTAAILGGVATGAGQDWYDGLDKPGFTPPDATFGIVWTVLYVAIAVSGWLAWRGGAAITRRRDDGSANAPTVAWAVQMGLNLLWTVVFFGLRAPWVGVAVIAALLAAIVVTIELDRRVSPVAAALLVPYLAWVGFASALTVGVAVLN